MLHPLVGEVTLVRSARARRISLSVRADGAVRLTLPYRTPEQRALDFLASKVDWILRTRARVAARQHLTPTLPPAEQQAHIEALRRRAKEDLPPRLARMEAASGLHSAGLTLRASRTRWGSCSARNTLSLSIFLVELPEHLRDFVILHELCHTRHHNHSAAFHALLDRLVGGREQALNRELRRYSIR